MNINERKIKVLYIAGNGRSGSTLLDVILGQIPSFFPVGEVRNIWNYGLVENRPCGCGVPFRECEIWSEILNDEFNGTRTVDPQKIAYWRERFAQTKRLIPMILQPNKYTSRANKELCTYIGILERLYNAIAKVTGSRVIVDSSKWPTYAFLLDLIPSIDLYVLHLVRDPRACAFSWDRKKEAEPSRNLDIQGPIKCTSYWMVWNPAISYFWNQSRTKYKFMRYEDFVTTPRDHIREIAKFIQEDDSKSLFVNDHKVNMARTHTIAGNPARFFNGPLNIKADNEWSKKMSFSSKMIVTAMTWPFLLKYGYWK